MKEARGCQAIFGGFIRNQGRKDAGLSRVCPPRIDASTLAPVRVCRGNQAVEDMLGIDRRRQRDTNNEASRTFLLTKVPSDV
jgi:hypothetical protein